MEDNMKKTLKKLLIAFIALLGVASLTSCIMQILIINSIIIVLI